VKSEGLLVVPRGGFEIRSKILGCEELTQSVFGGGNQNRNWGEIRNSAVPRS
jgi:hypothetical protein